MIRIFTILFFISISITHLNAKQFKDVFPDMGIRHFSQDDYLMSGGAAVIDLNNDGYEDLFLCGGRNQQPMLLRNNPDAQNYEDRFTNIINSSGISIPQGVMTFGAAVGDYNNDGWQDLIVTTDETSRNFLYRNNGDGTFSEVSQQLGMSEVSMSMSASWGDVNQDGWIDLYVMNYIDDTDVCLPNYFYINQEGKGFVQVAANYGIDDQGCGLACTFSDYDGDGDVDLFVANDFGMNFSSNALFRNEYPEAKFTDVRNETGFNAAIFGMGVEGGDYDKDGDFDYYVTNIGHNPFYEYQGSDIFVEKAVELGIDDTRTNPDDPSSGLTVGWGINWIDYDNDTDVDLYVSNGFLAPVPGINTEYTDESRMYRNNDDGTFEEVGEELGLNYPWISRGSAHVDFDRDGDLDLLTTVTRANPVDPSYNGDEWYQLFENQLDNGNNWLQVKLIGSTSNALAQGAKVKAYLNNGDLLLREITSGGGSYLSQSTLVKHFGLGQMASVDSIVVEWPSSVRNTVLSAGEIKINSRITIIEPYIDTVEVDVCRGESFLNETWNESGFKTFSNTAYNGADSITTVHVIVNDHKEDEVNVEICRGETFMDQEWFVDGTFSENLETYKGCDSVINYNVAVLETPQTEIDTSICYASFFEGKEYIESTTINKVFDASNGCDSLVTINVNVVDAPKYVENFEFCFGTFFQGEYLTEKTIINRKFQTDQGCDSVHTMIVDVLPVARTNDTVRINEGDTYRGKQYFDNGVYQERIPGGASNGCDSIYTVYVRVATDVYFDLAGDNEFEFKALPNPFNTGTEISYFLDNAANVRLDLYDELGNLKSTLVNSYEAAGRKYINIDGSNFNGSSGMYLMKLTVNGKSVIRKLIKVR